MDDSRLLQPQGSPQGTTAVRQAIMSEGLSQGPYLVARGGVEPATFHTEGTDNHHSTNHALRWVLSLDKILVEDDFRIGSGKLHLRICKVFNYNPVKGCIIV